MVQENNEEERITSLPFSEIKQEAVLGHLLREEQFFKQARTRILPEWFKEGHVAKIYRAQLDLYEKYKRFPTVSEVKESENFLKETQEVRNKLIAKINLAELQRVNFKLDIIADELTKWMHARIYQKGVKQSYDLYKREKFEQCYEVVAESVKEIQLTNFAEEPQEKFEKPEEEIKERIIEREKAISFGINLVDNLLLPDTPAGSLLPGDETLLLAPTNVGKTTTMLTIVRHALYANKRVLLLTHEGRPADIKDKLWCSMLSCTKPQLYYEAHKDPDKKQAIEKVLLRFKNQLTYIPMNKPFLTVEEVEAVIRRRQEDLINKTGKGYDLVVDDYPAKLTTQQAKGGLWAPRHVLDTVYNVFVQLALDCKFHVLTAVQTNRSGSKQNQDKDDDRLLSMEMVAEAWGPMTTATNVISINRDKMAEAKNRVTFYVCKSRSSETGYAIVCKSDFGRAISHSDKLGGVWYRGGSSMAEKIDTLYTQYEGGEVPEKEVPF